MEHVAGACVVKDYCGALLSSTNKKETGHGLVLFFLSSPSKTSLLPQHCKALRLSYKHMKKSLLKGFQNNNVRGAHSAATTLLFFFVLFFLFLIYTPFHHLLRIHSLATLSLLTVVPSDHQTRPLQALACPASPGILS
jgi:hypothetical protein